MIAIKYRIRMQSNAWYVWTYDKNNDFVATEGPFYKYEEAKAVGEASLLIDWDKG